jgi:DNA helicase-2/ATP-dependent DNA helicase PcrA
MRGRPGALRLHPAASAAPAAPAAPAALAAPAAPAAPGAADTVPRVVAYEDDDAQARGVAAAVAGQIRAGTDPQQIAVLYRAHAQSAEILRALADAHVPATVLGGRRFFDMPEVRQAVLALRGASVAPLTGGFVDAVRDVLRSLGQTDEPPAAGGALRDAWEARRALLRLAEDAPEGTSLRSFTDDIMARAKDQHEPTLHTVTLATLHAAKGLEWDHVHLIGMSEGLLPISYATTFEQVDEERRLAYVGITRAARTLSLSWSRGGRTSRSASRFLQEIGSRTLRAVDAPATGAAVRGRSPSPTMPPRQGPHRR